MIDITHSYITYVDTIFYNLLHAGSKYVVLRAPSGALVARRIRMDTAADSCSQVSGPPNDFASGSADGADAQGPQ